jgi:hypothetical protein
VFYAGRGKERRLQNIYFHQRVNFPNGVAPEDPFDWSAVGEFMPTTCSRSIQVFGACSPAASFNQLFDGCCGMMLPRFRNNAQTGRARCARDSIVVPSRLPRDHRPHGLLRIVAEEKPQ